MSIPVIYVEAAEEKIKIIDAEGQEYYFPKTFELRSEAIPRRSATLDAAYVHGVLDVSDGMFGKRIVEISGKIWAASDAEFNTKCDAIAEHLAKENFRIQNRGRQINIKRIENMSRDDPSTLRYPYGEVSIQLLVIDPFWYAKNAKSKEITITSSPHEFTWGIGGNIEVFPIIIFYNQASNTDFTLRNITDSNREFRITDSNAVAGTTITVNCEEGTAVRGTTDIISSFSKLFVRLLGGRDNRFRYTGANCKITMQYREAWI